MPRCWPEPSCFDSATAFLTHSRKHRHVLHPRRRPPESHQSAARADSARATPSAVCESWSPTQLLSQLKEIRPVPFDLVIDIENRPGALAEVAQAISDAGVNIAAATCIGPGDRAELHILVPHAEAVRHALAISNLAVSREREVVVVEVEDQPGVLADLTRRVARADIDLDLVYVATRNRIVFGAADLAGLRAALGQS